MSNFKLANSKNGGGILDIKSKNAFTLIELLAIIVILAIIAVITVPIILNIIENSRMGAATDSAYGYKDAVNKWYVTKLQEDNQFQLADSYTISSDGKLGDIVIPISGDKPSGGYLNYSNNTLTAGCLVIGDYAVTFDGGNATSTIKGDCSSSSNNSGNETSGDTNNVVETWDKYISSYYEDDTPPDSYSTYIRENTSTNKREICGTFDYGTLCFDVNEYNDISTAEKKALASQYILAKKQEAEAYAVCKFYSDGEEVENFNIDDTFVECSGHGREGYTLSCIFGIEDSYCSDYAYEVNCYYDYCS